MGTTGIVLTVGDLLGASLSDLQGDSMDVVGCRVREALSGRTAAAVEVVSDADLRFDDSLGEPAALEIGGEHSRNWTLVLAGSRYLGEHEGAHRHLLELRDRLWLLGHTEDTRKFRHRSAEQIVTQVLEQAGIAHRWQLRDPTPTRKYCVQYRESNLAFVERLLAFEGVAYRLDPAGVLLLSDASPAAPRVAGESTFELIESAEALRDGAAGIHRIRRLANLRPGRVTLADYSWKTPDLQLRQSASCSRDADLERYQYPAGFRKPEQGARLAALRLEQQRVEAQLLEGEGTVASFAPGHAFAFGEQAGEMFAGQWLLIDVEHVAAAGDRALRSGLAEAGVGYRNRFTAMPLGKRYRPPLRHARPDVGGAHSAMVRGPAGEEIHTDQHGRFRAQMHWDREAIGSDEDSRWLRKLQETATSMNLARVGWEMFVGYVDGDPERPVGIGRAINGVMSPEYALPDNKNVMALRTPSSPSSGGFNELKMDDTASSQHIDLRAEKELTTLVKHDKCESVGEDERHAVGSDLARQVTGNQAVTVGGDSRADYGNNHMLLVEGARSKRVSESESLTIVGNKADVVGGSDEETVGLLRLTLAGSLRPPDFGELARSAAMSFAHTAAPGAFGLYNQAQSYYQTAQQPGAMAPSEGQLRGVGSGALGDGAEAGWGAWREGAGARGVSNEAGAAFGGSLENRLSGMLPSQLDFDQQMRSFEHNLDSAIPTSDTLSSALTSGADALTGGVYSSLKNGNYTAALNQAIALFASGGIARTAERNLLKVVGGAYVTTAVNSIDWSAGLGYAETVGGIKLTSTKGAMGTTSDGHLIITVGGSVMRTAKADMTIDSGASELTVAGTTSMTAGPQLEIKGNEVTLKAEGSLEIAAGGAVIEVSPDAVTITGDLSLAACDAITIIGNTRLCE